MLPSVASGGAFTAFRAIVLGLRGRGLRAEAVILGSRPDRGPDRDRGEELAARYLGVSGGWADVFRRTPAARAVRAALEELRPGVVHSHLWPAAFACGRPPAGVRHVLHVQDTRPWVRGRKLPDRARRAAARRAARGRAALCVSAAVAEYHAPLLEAGRVLIAPNAVDRDRFAVSDPPAGPLRLVVLARFSPEKGHRELLLSLADLRAAGVPFRAVFAGSGSLRAELEALAAELSVADAVEFPGEVADVRPLLAAAHLHVLPTLGCEGLPLCIREAAACGRPTFASAVPGVPEAVRDGVDGRLLPPGDRAAWSSALREAAGDAAGLAGMGRRARAAVPGWGETIDRVVGVYTGASGR